MLTAGLLAAAGCAPDVVVWGPPAPLGVGLVGRVGASHQDCDSFEDPGTCGSWAAPIIATRAGSTAATVLDLDDGIALVLGKHAGSFPLTVETRDGGAYDTELEIVTPTRAELVAVDIPHPVRFDTDAVVFLVDGTFSVVHRYYGPDPADPAVETLLVGDSKVRVEPGETDATITDTGYAFAVTTGARPGLAHLVGASGLARTLAIVTPAAIAQVELCHASDGTPSNSVEVGLRGTYTSSAPCDLLPLTEDGDLVLGQLPVDPTFAVTGPVTARYEDHLVVITRTASGPATVTATWYGASATVSVTEPAGK